jgi:hypothetical protein
LEALRGLRRRSLIEQNAHGCGLQNVVTEYLTDVLIEQVCREIAGEPKNQELRTQNIELATPSGLNRHALLKATAKEYVRASQIRLIVQPITQRLAASLGGSRLAEKLRLIIGGLHEQGEFTPGYAAGNILNLRYSVADGVYF